MRRPLTFAVALSLLVATTAAAEAPFRVRTEDASTFQCRNEFCTTLQVTHETFSDGRDFTMLVFFHHDPTGALIEIAGCPSGFTGIPNEAFFMAKPGHARLRFGSCIATWDENGDRSVETDLTEITTERTLIGIERHKLTEKSDQVSADVEGSIGPVVIGAVPPSEGFSSAFLTFRKTTSRTRLK
jgi:hypothetical protein